MRSGCSDEELLEVVGAAVGRKRRQHAGVLGPGGCVELWWGVGADQDLSVLGPEGCKTSCVCVEQ